MFLPKLRGAKKDHLCSEKCCVFFSIGERFELTFQLSLLKERGFEMMKGHTFISV